MNEFILWHTLRKEFVQPYRNIVFDDNGIAKSDLCTIHNYIGMNDISNNKIYDDCSIVEFEWKISGLKKIGYFYYNNESLCYMIKWIGEMCSDVLFYDKHTMKNFKIIDTIQENKLGLINKN